MIFLNGIAPIVGLGFIHVTIINLAAIVIEYQIIKRRHNISMLLLRTIVANIVSLVIGLILLFSIPDFIGGNIGRTDSAMTTLDKFSLFAGLTGLFLANVIIEFPGYVIGFKTNYNLRMQIFKTVLMANILTNIPVIILYGLLAL